MNLNFALISLLFLIYWMVIIYLDRKNVLKKYNITAIGPILMIRTKKGLHLIDVLARPKKLWRIFGNIGIIAMLISMMLMFFFVAFSIFTAFKAIQNGYVPETGKLYQLKNVFLIPGLNDYIPLWSGAVALFVTLVVHEFSHAILSRVEDVNVKSMGVLLALVPIGGFAEPDEEQLFGKSEKQDIEINDRTEVIEKRAVETKHKATQIQRTRILSAGIMANFVVAAIAMALFFGPVLGALAPVGNIGVSEVASGSYAEKAGITHGMILTHVNGQAVYTSSDIGNILSKMSKGDILELVFVKNKQNMTFKIPVTDTTVQPFFNIVIDEILPDTAAQEAGLKKGMQIYRVNNLEIKTIADLTNALNAIKPGENTEFYVLTQGGDLEKIDIVPRPKPENPEKAYFGFHYKTQALPPDRLGFSVSEFNSEAYLKGLGMIPRFMMGVEGKGLYQKINFVFAGFILFISLPFFGLTGEGFRGFGEELMQFYEPVGWASSLGSGVFLIANILIWIAWINFYVGLFNCLPALPLDGGHVFQTYAHELIKKFKMKKISDEKADAWASGLTLLTTMFIFGSFLFMFIWPHIGKLIVK